MINKTNYTLIVLFAVSLCVSSCKKDASVIPDAPESPKPTADFTYSPAGADDPFTFKFDNKSTNFKEVRWEFGDDSTTTELSPNHTFIAVGDYRIRVISTNEDGYWAQKETTIKLRADSILNFNSIANAGGKITLALSTKAKFVGAAWYKGSGSTAKLISKGETTTIDVAPGSYDVYSLRITTPKGSIAEINRQVGSEGVLRDVTGNGIFSVSRDNDSGPASDEGSLKLVDNNTASKFVQFNYTGDLWAQLDFQAHPVALGAYSLTSGNDAPERDPKNFTLEGSKMFAQRALTKTYLFHNTVAFRYYRLNIPVDNGAGLIQIAEWRTMVAQ
jgi:PKD repeat protein